MIAAPEIACFRCGYSLAGLSDDIVCPECEFPVGLSRSPSGRVRAVLPSISAAAKRLLWMVLLDIGAIGSMLYCLAVFLPTLEPRPQVMAAFGGYVACNVLGGLISMRFASSVRAISLVSASLKRARIALALMCWIRALLMFIAALSWIAGVQYLLPIGIAAIVFSGMFEWMARVALLRAIRRLDTDAGWAQSKEGFEAFLVLSVVWVVMDGILATSMFVRTEAAWFVSVLWAMSGVAMIVLAINLTVRTRQFLLRMSNINSESSNEAWRAEIKP